MIAKGFPTWGTISCSHSRGFWRLSFQRGCSQSLVSVYPQCGMVSLQLYYVIGQLISLGFPNDWWLNISWAYSTVFCPLVCWVVVFFLGIESSSCILEQFTSDVCQCFLLVWRVLSTSCMLVKQVMWHDWPIVKSSVLIVDLGMRLALGRVSSWKSTAWSTRRTCTPGGNLHSARLTNCMSCPHVNGSQCLSPFSSHSASSFCSDFVGPGWVSHCWGQSPVTLHALSTAGPGT